MSVTFLPLRCALSKGLRSNFCHNVIYPVVNVLGAPSGDMTDTMKGVNAAMSMPRAVVHWYGKG